MVIEQTYAPRHRLAWLILIASFVACLVLTISVPVAATTFARTATETLDVFVQANAGTVRVDSGNGSTMGLVAGRPGQNISPNSSVVTGNTATAVMGVFPPKSTEERMARLEVFSNTTLRLESAETPRFALSNRDNLAEIELEIGRIRLSLLEGERPLTVNINTPQSDITLDSPGQYQIIVTNEATDVTVQSGEARVAAIVNETTREIITLTDDTRAKVPTGGGPIGREGTDRNLVANSSFQNGQDSWTFFAWNIDEPNQPEGVIDLESEFGEPRLHVLRDGIGHADFRIRQVIRQDVTDLEALQLSLTFRIKGQSLGVCGGVGSECPLFIRINYIDEQGNPQVWQQGFFAVGTFSNDTPEACIHCALIQSQHLLVPLDQDFFYEVNLPNVIASQGAIPPRFIENVELVTSGHSFNVEIFNVTLLAID